MTVPEIINQLASLGNAKLHQQNEKRGVVSKQYGVMLGELRKIAKKIKLDQKLALKLWETGVYEAQLIAILVMDPILLTANELENLVQTTKDTQVADWLNSYIVKLHPENEALRLKWMTSTDPMSARAGWNLTAQRVVRQPEIIDIPGLLKRLEKEMGTADPLVQWTMNFTLAYIGIHHPKYREQALKIGESLGIYRDYPVSKGCTSPFAPIWINEMVGREGKV